MNLLFQNAGSMLVKWATVRMMEHYVPKHNLDCLLVLHMHDEFELECVPEDVDKAVECALQSFLDAGVHFKMNIPIEGDAQVGSSWAEVH